MPLAPLGGTLWRMTDVTQLLDAAANGDRQAAADLLPLVYDELRKLAAALVHEAYVRLVGGVQSQDWDGRGHFFAAAAEAMRRILVESARRKLRERHGGGRKRLTLDDLDLAADAAEDDELVALGEALDRLAAVNPRAADRVKLRFFAGLSGREAAGVLNISPRKADQVWAYARAWLLDRLNDGTPG